MNIRPIRNEADHAWALSEIGRYFDHEPEEGTPEADRFDVLATLIEAYERQHWPMESGTMTPVEALKEFMALTGKSQSDLANLLGYRSRASEILLGKRELTVDMMNMLVREWKMPADLLIGTGASSGKAA
ncbi:XRE family transcriptional regulator [Aquibium sp. LZ166]|uniref:XRE family transcriptional regulator n=1 Tax=Aquibium pacificus TaxID=3153579 RepID=A0ABV3SH95_9HYPH